VSDTWYFSNGKDQVGPLGLEALKATLATYDNARDLLVWRQGFAEWKRATDVPELGATPITPPPPLAGQDKKSDAAKPAAPDEPERTIGSAKWVWAIGGAVLGLAIALSDFMFAWRGSRLPPWSGPGLWYNLRLLAFSTFVFAAIAFIIGASNDRVRSRPIVQRAYRFTNFIARNWRGEFPLWMSFWGFGFFGALATSILTYVATEKLLGDAAYDPRTVMACLVAISIGILVVSTWQLVGIWRTANREMREAAPAGQSAGWASAAKVAVVFGILYLFTFLFIDSLPQIVAMYREAFAAD
jgi:hypothetical protein